MKFSDFVLSFLILLIFGILLVSGVILTKILEIKNNWNKYKCNPMIMPFASYFGHDPVENFTYCIAETQKDLMQYFLAPLTYALGKAGSLGSALVGDLQNMRSMFNVGFLDFGNILDSFFGAINMFKTIFITFVVNIGDVISKITGAIVSILYTFAGVSFSAASIVDGPIVKTMTFIVDCLGGQGDENILQCLCFKPDTEVILKSGEKRAMKDLHLGDILENGSEVLGTLRLKGNKDNKYYKIFSKKLNKEIYVTGSHQIYDETEKSFLKVSEFMDSEETDLWDEELSCLITDNHKIPIGEFTFWDWED